MARSDSSKIPEVDEARSVLLTMDSAFERPAWGWDDPTEEPVEIDPGDASREEIAEALENTRREIDELEELTYRLDRLQREIERLEASPVETEDAGRSVGSDRP